MMKKRGGFRCVYKHCKNSTGKSKGISFFRFPKDAERSALWVQACGREDLINKSAEDLYKNYKVCQMHFKDHMFLNDLKNRLHNYVCPQKVTDDTSKEEQTKNDASVVSGNESTSGDKDPLDFTSDELALLQGSENIEFVIEEDELQESEGECETIYLYENSEDSDEDYQGQSDSSIAENADLRTNNIDDIFDESTEEDDPQPVKRRRGRKRKSSVSRNENSSKKLTQKTTRSSKKVKRDNATPNASLQQKFVTPKITSVQGGVDASSTGTPSKPLMPKIAFIQGGPKTVTETVNALSQQKLPFRSLGEPQLLPDQAVGEIVKALGLSIEDIEKHGGTVAVSIPETLIQNGVLDLTKLSAAERPSGIQQLENVENYTPTKTKGSRSAIRGKKIIISSSNKCYVENCDSYEEKEPVFFKAPANRDMRKVWDICLGSVNRRLSETDKLCVKHFHKSDIKYVKSQTRGHPASDVFRMQLVDGAVPCIDYHHSCCVPVCDSKHPKKMYNFPVYNKTNNELWLYMIKNPSLRTLNIRELLRHRVCSKHFDSGSFSLINELRRTAAPTKFLPVADYKSMKMVVPSMSPLLDFSNVKLRCAYKRCQNRLNPGIKTFPFPSDFFRCQDWLYACDRLDLLCPTADATMIKLFYLKFGLCVAHFDFRDFEDLSKLQLVANVVPKLFFNGRVVEDKDLPGCVTSEIVDDSLLFSHANEKAGDIVKTSRERSNKILPYVCFYLGCNKKNLNKQGEGEFFSFPEEPKRRKQWLEACGYKNFGEVEVTYKICKSHFAPDMFDGNGKLKPNAIPKRSIQIIDGPGQHDDDSNQSIHVSPHRSDHPLSFVDDSDDDVALSESVNKLLSQTDRSKLEFLRCVIPNCDKVYTNHSYKGKAQLFPDPTYDRQWYDAWLKLMKSSILRAMTPDVLRQTYVICNSHFETHCLVKQGMGLVRNAIPTIDISFPDSEGTISSSSNQKNRSFTRIYPKTDGFIWKQLDSVDLADSKDKTLCLLEDSHIVFPGMGYYLVDYVKDPKKGVKRLYDVYQYTQDKNFSLTEDFEFGESLNIHTAIIIDDNDAIEKEVIQKILSKRIQM